jgi:hypothetical protein
MVGASPEPWLRDSVEAIGYSRSDLENVAWTQSRTNAANDGSSNEGW